MVDPFEWYFWYFISSEMVIKFSDFESFFKKLILLMIIF